jgi:protein ImuB
MTSLPATNTRTERNVPDEIAGPNASLRLAMRLFRPALRARVRVVRHSPKTVLAAGVKGSVLELAGPWKTSGEWWTTTAWSHEEWDVALDDGALYRIYQESNTGQWFVHGIYD